MGSPRPQRDWLCVWITPGTELAHKKRLTEFNLGVNKPSFGGTLQLFMALQNSNATMILPKVTAKSNEFFAETW
jgi:hypothetical protein